MLVMIMTNEEDALSLGGPAELYRRKLVEMEQAKEAMIGLLKGEVATMQGQLNSAYKRINELNQQITELKKIKDLK